MEFKQMEYPVANPAVCGDMAANVRSFGKVFGLSIITLGIYFLVYLFKTLAEIETAFTSMQEEVAPNGSERSLDRSYIIAPNKIRTLLIVYLVLTISLFFVGIGTGIMNLLEHPGHLEVSSGVRMEKIITTIISAFLTIMFWVPFVNLIEVCHRKREIVPINKEILWLLLTVMIVLSFASIIGSGIVTMILAVISIPVSLVFMYLVVNQVNRIWHTE